MNAVALTRAAFAAIPPGFKATVTVTDANGDGHKGMAITAPANGAGSDSFAQRTTIRSKNRQVIYRPKDEAFVPTEGMTLAYATGKSWALLAAVPLDPTESAAALYLLTLQR